MVSRRDFLTRSAAATALMAMPVELHRGRESRCVVLDLGERCALRESLLGYTKTLRERAVVSGKSESAFLAAFGRTGQLIVPGANHIESSTLLLIQSCLDHGGTVVLESGTAFGDCREYHEALRKYLGVLVEPVVDVWPAHGIPYIEYTWPIATKVRDFSRVLPVAPQRGTIIGRVRGMPVALAQRVGPGTLVYLGSPLGQALWAGDAEATRWLAALVALGGRRQT